MRDIFYMTQQKTRATFDCPVCGNPLYFSRAEVISCCYCRQLIIPPDRMRHTQAEVFTGERKRRPRRDFSHGGGREAAAE
jgi:hypothetical protein